MPDDRPSTTGPDSLQAPWRLTYLEGQGPSEAVKAAPQGTGSFLLDYWDAPAADGPNHVIVRVPGDSPSLTGSEHAGSPAFAPIADWRGPGGIILLNKYPYSNGHLLVALGVARGRLVDYSHEERAALWRLVDLAADLMERALQPQGINIGVNQGRAAGAGVPQHLHAHLVPRWSGDVNYMTTIGGVRVNPAALEAMAERYRRVWRVGRP